MPEKFIKSKKKKTCLKVKKVNNDEKTSNNKKISNNKDANLFSSTVAAFFNFLAFIATSFYFLASIATSFGLFAFVVTSFNFFALVATFPSFLTFGFVIPRLASVTSISVPICSSNSVFVYLSLFSFLSCDTTFTSSFPIQVFKSTLLLLKDDYIV